LLVLTLQGQQQALRMRTWRALKALGTAVLRDGVYLLPKRTELVDALQTVADEVQASEGSAQIFEIDAQSETQEAEFRRLFDRTADYEKLMIEISTAKKAIGVADRAAMALRVTRLRRDCEGIVVQDFFPGASQDQACDALEDLARATSAVLSPDEPHAATGEIKRVELARYQGRTWATRARPWADRLASVWLIKRFIDPDARFVWLRKPKDCPKRAVGFDFDGAEFTHIGAKVTFEVLLASFGLNSDPALEKIAALIHYLDVGGVPASEAAGVEALLRGAYAALTDDDQLALEAAKLFEFLYLHYTAIN
jgi:hypothetical protein